MMLTTGKRRWVALDYDSRQVRLVVFEYVRGLPVVRSLHTAAIPETVNGSDAPALGRRLKTLVDRLNLGGCKALMCVGRAQVVLKSLTLPPGSAANDLPGMVQFQVAKELPFSADEAVVDFTPGGHWDTGSGEPAGEGVTVLAAAARLPDLETAKSICAEAGLDLQRLTFRPYANLRAVYRCVDFQPSERLLFVDVTADEAEIDVISDQTLEFSRAAKIASPKAPPGATPEAAAEQHAAVVTRVLAEVSRSLAGFDATGGGAQITACLVAGSTGIEGDVVAALTESLGAPCERFDPSAGYGIMQDEQVFAFGAALGMATRRQAEVPPFDFLNPKRPLPPQNPRRLQLMVAGAAVALVLFGAVLARAVYLGGYADDKKALEKDNRELVVSNKQLLQVQKPVDNVRKWLGGDVNWLDQLAHLSNTLPPADRVYVMTFGAGGDNTVSLRGRAKDEESMSDFYQRMMGMKGYSVRPKKMSPTKDPLGYSQDFTVDVLVSPQAEAVLTTTQPAGRPAGDAAGREGRSGNPPARPSSPQPAPTVKPPSPPQPSPIVKPANPQPRPEQPQPPDRRGRRRSDGSVPEGTGK